VVFQDFMRYQFAAGENIGVGDVGRWEDAAGWQRAARQAGAEGFLEQLPAGYHTQLGRWFPGGVELSGGQWQKVALARALFRQGADILVLDEPTAAMDPRAEAEVFAHVRQIARSRMTILVSHRFSTVRMADRILVLDRGRVREQGSHPELLAQGGIYAQLFQLQADALLGA
jgi:ATP-binding cassette subfamily B protein